MATANGMLHGILRTSELLSYPTDEAQWFAWSHEMKGLFHLAGVYDAVFGITEEEDMWAWNADIHWDNDNLGAKKVDDDVLAQCMLVASIAPEYKRMTQYRGLDLHANPRRLWKRLEESLNVIRIGGYVN